MAFAPFMPSRAETAGGSPGDNLARLQAALEQARKKSNKEALADALYDYAKALFEAHQPEPAVSYMKECMETENGLKRPLSAIQEHVALANILVTVKKPDEAISEYKSALALARANKMTDQAAAIVDNMGTLALISGRYDEAEKLFQSARQQAASEGNTASEGNALINLAVLSRARNKPQDALSLLNEAISRAKNSGDDRVLGAAYMEFGRTQSDMGKAAEAIASYKQATDLQKGQLDDVSAAKSLLAIGQIYLTQDKFAPAGEVLQEAAQLVEQDQNDPVYIDILIASGGAEAGLGHFGQAQKLHNKALAIAKTTGNVKKERTIYSELGYDAIVAGSPELALERYMHAYSLLGQQEPGNSRQKGILLTDIAMSCKAVGQLPAAIANYEQAVDNFEKAGDTASKAMALNSLSVAYLDNGMLPEFERTYASAKSLFVSLNDKKGQAMLEYNLAQYRLVQGHPADSVSLFEAALEHAAAASDMRFQSQVLRGLGLSYIYLGRAGKALECYQKAEPLVQSGGSIEAQWECALGLGKSYKALGNLPEAINYLRKAADLVEKERSQLSRDTFKTYNLDLRQDCFIELVDALVASHNAAEALVVAEKGRARAFLDLLEGRKTRRPSEDAQGAFQSSPERLSLADLSGVKASGDGSRGVEVVPRVNTFVEATTISPINAQPPNLEEIKSLVARNGSTFVEYYVLPDKVLIWVVRPNGDIQMAPNIVITRKALTEKISQAYKNIIAHPKGPEEFRQINQARQHNLEELHALLVEPVLPLLPKSADDVLTIVPHGPLYSVPFAALIDQRGKYFVENHTIGYIPAIGVLRATQKLSEEAQAPKDQLLAFGNPITKQISFLGALPYSEKEVHHVAELFGAVNSVVKIGADANKEAFTKLAPHSTVIHLATHGLVNEEHPMDSALVLAPEGKDDGLLTVKDILQLPALKARLIVLSACQTARGKITGDGVVGLSRSFIIAGTPSILVSQWNVDDVITEFQMVEFYRTLLSGSEKARALRQAQLKTIALLESSSGSPPGAAAIRANPRYWAAFELIGEHK